MYTEWLQEVEGTIRCEEREEEMDDEDMKSCNPEGLACLSGTSLHTTPGSVLLSVLAASPVSSCIIQKVTSDI